MRAFLAILLALAAIAALPTVALAHGGMQEEPTPALGMGPAGGHGAEELEIPDVRLTLPEHATLGGMITVRARLTDPHDGEPIPGATVTFEMPALWGEEFQGHMAIGIATTDENGVASITTQLRTSGDVEISAAFAGGGGFGPVEGGGSLEVAGSRQLYSPTAGIRVPGLNLWVLAGVIGVVWALYFLVGLRILAIARATRLAISHDVSGEPTVTRRQFFGRLLPLGAQAGIAALGTGLVAVVARSPRTHGNLMAPPSTGAYRRTPLAHVGQTMEMREMPAPLTRQVSFSKEVLPIFLANGGPHVAQPKNSPPPGGLRLDAYEHVMAREGVVVPGKPDKSEIIDHLLSPAMQMPPSIPPLPNEQIQVIVTWIAQGARDN